ALSVSDHVDLARARGVCHRHILPAVWIRLETRDCARRRCGRAVGGKRGPAMKGSPDMPRRMWQALVRLDGYERLFFVLAAIQAGAVWLHRSFPTQDGPIQIYLADVLGDLIRGTGHYSGYYQPQGYAHPYSFCL